MTTPWLRLAILLAAVLLAPVCCAGTFTLDLKPGWNLVSVPIAPTDPSVEAVFQGQNLGAVWYWDTLLGVYRAAQQIVPGTGYWVYGSPAPGPRDAAPSVQLTVTGAPVREIRRTLPAGWNLVGSIGYEPYGQLPVPLQSSQSGAVAGDAFAWTGQACQSRAALLPGQGAWVYLFRESTVCLSPNPEFEGAVMGVLEPHAAAARAPVSTLRPSRRTVVPSAARARRRRRSRRHRARAHRHRSRLRIRQDVGA